MSNLVERVRERERERELEKGTMKQEVCAVEYVARKGIAKVNT